MQFSALKDGEGLRKLVYERRCGVVVDEFSLQLSCQLAQGRSRIVPSGSTRLDPHSRPVRAIASGVLGAASSRAALPAVSPRSMIVRTIGRSAGGTSVGRVRSRAARHQASSSCRSPEAPYVAISDSQGAMVYATPHNSLTLREGACCNTGRNVGVDQRARAERTSP